MADKKISQLTGASTPLAGTEVLPIVQGGSTVKVPVSDLTAGRVTSAAKFVPTAGDATGNGMYLSGANELGFSTNGVDRAKLSATGWSVEDATAPKMSLKVGASERAFWRYTEATFTVRFDSDGPIELAANNAVGLTISVALNVSAGAGSLATTATDGFLYVPTCAGTPTGTPTAITGFAPLVVNTTNNKLYFYSSGVWRDAGP
jgi:hypothetical protein